VKGAVDGGGSRRAVGAIRHFEDDVRLVVERIPAGTVATYGEVALEAGRAGAARAVGTYLSRGGSGLPWWRVVTSTGRLVPGHEQEHAKRLRSEGVRVANGRVVMRGRPVVEAE
jgi:methylated-DNA-protein-cysteine methyltransferase-like protein